MAAPAPSARSADIVKRTDKPAAFFLAGDSTTAAQSDYGGGWGTGFFSTLRNSAAGSNFGHNGATTVSFVSGGDWADLIESVTRYHHDYDVFVTIQFGHNDQKAASNISIDQFSANLKAFAQEIVSLDATPILVTSISRRNYNSSNLVIEDLAPQAAATIAVANALSVPYIDLNRASTDYLDAIGKTDAWLYNRIPTDFTHLNAAGSLVFGTLVSILMSEITAKVTGGRDVVGQVIAEHSRPLHEIKVALESGVFFNVTSS